MFNEPHMPHMDGMFEKPKGGKMSSLMERMLKTAKGNANNAGVLESSNFFGTKRPIETDVPALNIALQGCVEGGFTPGLIQLAGPSKHFKSNMGLALMKAYLDEYDDAICIFFDSEFGATPAYFESFEIDTARVVHEPIMNIEELKFRMAKYLDEIKRGDHVFLFIDSVGNLASKKEADDALAENSAADMTRAKQLKSLWRIVTPHLQMKDLTCVAINHTYQTQEMYAKTVVSGGTGNMYSSNVVITVGRRQVKDGKELEGYEFVLNMEKSRFVKEGSKIPLTVTFEGGINKWSGLLEIALYTGHVIKPKVGWYSRSRIEGDKNWRKKESDSEEFWAPVLEDESFKQGVRDLFQLGSTKMFNEDHLNDLEVDPETGEVL